jgi:single-strand DNA-binding protein
VSIDPVLRETANGTAVCSFGVATNRSGQAPNGEKREFVDFHNAVIWGSRAEIAAKQLHKGTPVHIDGRLSTRTWEGKDGTRRRTTEVVVIDFEPLELRTPAAASVNPDEVAF